MAGTTAGTDGVLSANVVEVSTALSCSIENGSSKTLLGGCLYRVLLLSLLY